VSSASGADNDILQEQGTNLVSSETPVVLAKVRENEARQ
jgi:hypothetical protein